MIYAAYEDEGPTGPCGQSLEITSPWHRLYTFNTFESLQKFCDALKAGKGRKRAKVTSYWTEEDIFEGPVL